MELNLRSLSTDPLTIQLNDQDQIPFKVIVKCQTQELSLNTYQRPITNEDKFLFEFINHRNLKNLASDIKDFKVQLKQESNNNEQNFQNRYEDTCKLLQGPDCIKPPNKKGKLKNFSQQYQTQPIQNCELLQSRNQIISQNIAQYSKLGTNRDEQSNFLQIDRYESRSQKTLVCGIYENESLSKIGDFIRSFKSQNVDLVILCNGIDQLDKELKQYLFMEHEKSALITIELDKNQYCVNNALVLQYDSNQKDLPRIIFMIKYFKSSNYDVQRWLYNGIGKHFDPDYFYVTSCSLIQCNDSISSQINSINQENVCAVTSSILHNENCSWNPLNPMNAFLLEKTLDQIENMSTNQLFSVVLDHNPFFCFYNWQKIKQFIVPYLQKIIKSECNYVQNIIVQGVNYILPCLTAEQGLFFYKSNTIVASASQSDSLSKIMNEQRKRKNSQIYTQSQFLDTYSFLSSTQQINFIIRFIQQIGLYVMFIHSNLNNYFCLSAITFIIAQSSYDFFGNAFNYYYFYIFQLSIPALFIFSVVILLIFAILFRSQYKIARAKAIKDPILISGNLILHIIHSPLINSCSYYFENVQLTRNNKQLSTANIQFVGSSPNQKIMNLYLYYGNTIYCANQFETNSMLKDIQQKSKESRQVRQEKKNNQFEYFAKIDCNDLCFNYQNQIGEAVEQYNALFYVLGFFNLFFLVLFILNIIFNYYSKVEDLYRFIICAFILVMILEKVIKMLLHLSHISVLVRGYLSYLFHFLMINFGMRFYEKINTDNNNENEIIKDFYYNKVQSFAIWISSNIFFLFICLMIESYYNFCGYVLLFFLSYFALSSFFSIIFDVISKVSCIKFKSFKQQKYISQNENIEYQLDQFSLGNDNYEMIFLQIQQEANYIYYKLQEQELINEKKRIENVTCNLQNSLQFNTRNRLDVIHEQSFISSRDQSTLINQKSNPIQNENSIDEDQLLHSIKF